MSIQDLIAQIGDRLTPTERRIAELVLRDPTLLAFGTVSDLADQVGTSRPSIVRFATKLGFEGYTELQQSIRDDMSHQLTSPSQRIRQRGAEIAPIRTAIEEAMHSTFQTLDDNRLDTLAQLIADARNVWILSGETSMAGAVVLHSGLSMVRPDVHLVQEHSTGRELSSATKSDTAVIFDFARSLRRRCFQNSACRSLQSPMGHCRRLLH
jgi:DNA-binding MurR/RpiR family transcriptional regulator